MLKKLLIGCAILALLSVLLVGAYAAAGFYLLPKLAQDELPALLSEMTGQNVQLRSVHVDPFELSADVRGGSVSTADKAHLLSFERLAVDVNVGESIKQRAVVLAFVELTKPHVSLERRADGRLNITELLEKLSAPGESPEPADTATLSQVLIHQISLTEGQIGWLDRPVGQQAKETLIPVNFSIAEVSTQPDSRAQFALNFNLASGGGLDWQGEVDLIALSSKGHIKVDDLALSKIWQLFLQDLLPLEIVEGRLSLQADYVFTRQDAADLQVVLNNAGVGIKQLLLNEKDKADSLISVPALNAGGIHLDLQKQTLDIGKVTSSDAKIQAWLQPDGLINYQALFAGERPASEPEASDEKAGQPWHIQLGELALANYHVEFTDHTQAHPVPMQFSELQASIQDYRNQDGVRLPVQFSTKFNKAGSLKLAGDMVLAPFSANWALEMQAIKLKTFQTYLDSFLSLELVDGDFNAQGQLNLTVADPLQLTYQGDANIGHLITRDKSKNKDFVKWANLEFKQMLLDVPRQDYKLSKVIFERPYIKFTIKKDGTNNVGDILVAQTQTKSAAKPADKQSQAAVKEPEPVVSIGRIEMKQGQSDFADYSLILPFVVKMNDLNGEVDGFVSNTDAVAKLKLQGRVHDLATVNIQGKYQLQSGDSEIKLNYSHMPLPLVTPYMAEFAGYKIEKGQMALDLAYSIKKGQLSAENKVFIDQLVLGEKVENPNAVSLPLELGVALLKDGDGKINLDFPITGSLEDPQFSVGSLVADVLVNLITKAVTSPFKAMASLFDADDDYSVVSFAAGSAELSAEELAKLDQIAKALNTKPELVLEVKGVAYEIQDWPVMRLDALTDILKKMKSGELSDRGEKIRSEYIELSDAEYQRLLAKFYAEVFPQKIDYSLFGKPRIKDNKDTDFYTVARRELEGIMQPEPQRLNDLAVNRANHIAKYLTEQAGIARNRIYILATELNNKDAAGGIHALLSLNVAS